MSFAFLPLYTGDYLRDTADLTLTEHGIYLRLLMYSWDSRGPVPIDESRAARIVGCSSDDERNAVKAILNRYFIRHDDGWYNPRMDREIGRANAISGARSQAGRQGATERMRRYREAEALAKQVSSKCLASDATPTPTTTPTPIKSTTLSGKPDPEPPESVRQSQTRQHRADAITVLAFLNAKAGREFKPVPANVDLIVTRLREGFTVQDCKSVVAKKVREWSGDDKMAEFLRPKTLFNRTNFANYEGELVTPEE